MLDSEFQIKETIPRESLPEDNIKRGYSLTKEGVAMELYGKKPILYDHARGKVIEKVTYFVITYWHILIVVVVGLFFFIATLIGKSITRSAVGNQVDADVNGPVDIEAVP